MVFKTKQMEMKCYRSVERAMGTISTTVVYKGIEPGSRPSFFFTDLYFVLFLGT